MKTKLFFHLVLILLLSWSSAFAQNSEIEVWVAIENQSGIKVSYITHSTDSDDIFFIKLTNLGEQQMIIEYSVFAKITSIDISHSNDTIVIESGQSFLASEQPITLMYKEVYSDYEVNLTIK